MSGYLVQLKGNAPISVPAQARVSDFCACDYICEYKERVFAGDSDYTSDKTSFLFKKIRPADTVTIKLMKHGQEIAVISDNTYGQYYDGFAAQPLYIGFIGDWKLIFDEFGRGDYEIEVDLSILGASYTETSRTFKLDSYSEEKAYDTVKLVSYNEGNIVGSDFNYTNLIEGGWPTYFRLPGRFGNMQVEYESDRYYNSSYQLIQNRDKVVRKYTLSTRFIPDSLYYALAKNDFLANYHKVYAYDVFSTVEYNGHEVVLDTPGDATYNDRGNVIAEITFKDRNDNLIKRNV